MLSEFTRHCVSLALEFISGVDNDITDPLSCLFCNNMISSPEEYSPEYILSALHIEYLNTPKLACCTTPFLAIMDLNVHLNFLRI